MFLTMKGLEHSWWVKNELHFKLNYRGERVKAESRLPRAFVISQSTTTSEIENNVGLYITVEMIDPI